MYKNILLKHIIDYFKLKNIDYKKTGKTVMLNCPLCEGEGRTATIIPNTSIINCFHCKTKYNLIDVIRAVEIDKVNLSEEEILQYIKESFNVEIITPKDIQDTDKLLDFYDKNKWSLLAISPNSKIPVAQMKDWTAKEYRNKDQWSSWVKDDLNLGARTGKASNITVIDIDILTKEEKKEFRFKKMTVNRKKELLDKRIEGLNIVYNEIKDIMGSPLIQENLGGTHLIYQYEEDFPKTKAKIANINIDIENDGGYILIEPSKIGITARTFKELKLIPKMSDNLKKYLKNKITIPRKTNSEIIKENIKTGNFKVKPNDFQLKNNGLENTCNSSIVSLGGIIRQELNPNQTEFVLQTFNTHLLEKPMDRRTISAMCRELEKYDFNDEQELAHEVLKHIKEVKEITKSDLELSIAGEWTKGESKKRFNKIIQYLIKEEKITQVGKKIKIIEDLDWKDTLLDIGAPVDFKVPYLNDYAYFCKGDIIIIGSKFGYGKSTLAINIIKRLVDQNIKPYYIYSEKQGGRFARTAEHLGLREGSFFSARCSNPDNVILRPNSVTIYDWVRPNKEQGFARTDLLFDKLVEKAEKTDSFLICFVQLREDDSFFAKDQIGQYPTVLAKYVYESDDGTYTKFTFKKIREPKIQGSNIEVPCIYDWKSKEVKLVEELSEEEKKNISKKKEK